MGSPSENSMKRIKNLNLFPKRVVVSKLSQDGQLKAYAPTTGTFSLQRGMIDQSVSDHFVHTLSEQLPKGTWLFLPVEQSTGTNNSEKLKLMLKMENNVRLEIQSVFLSCKQISFLLNFP